MDITNERYKLGDMSEGDLLKIRLQLLQFQSDLSMAKLSKIQALASLRQFLGFESVPDNYDVEGELAYTPVHAGVDDLKALALRERPDLRQAQQGVVVARSQESLAEANGKRDLNVTFDYTHTNGQSSGAFYFNIDLPIFRSQSRRNCAHEIRHHAGTRAATGSRATSHYRRHQRLRQSQSQ